MIFLVVFAGFNDLSDLVVGTQVKAANIHLVQDVDRIIQFEVDHYPDIFIF